MNCISGTACTRGSTAYHMVGDLLQMFMEFAPHVIPHLHLGCQYYDTVNPKMIGRLMFTLDDMSSMHTMSFPINVFAGECTPC